MSARQGKDTVTHLTALGLGGMQITGRKEALRHTKGRVVRDWTNARKVGPIGRKASAVFDL